MTDFFVSYTSADERWAEWIAFTLEEQGFSVILQAWDFRPGSNFVIEMQKAAAAAGRTVMVLSPDYLKSQFANPEWAAAFATDPQGLARALIPVVVRDCQPTGMLKPMVHINLVGQSEREASARLLAGVKPERAKPAQRPSFPGAAREAPKEFPGAAETTAVRPGPYMPKMGRAATDVDRRRFVKQTFEEMRDHFRNGLDALAANTPHLEFEFEPVTAQEFTAEIFLGGKSVSACRVWLGGTMAQNGISYAEGRQNFGSNTCNEILSVDDQSGEMALSAMMGGFGFQLAEGLDTKRLGPDEAAEYLWRRFVSRLER